ncbi:MULTISPECIES: hemin uptake protein HemP [unclassified Rhodanobacter]|jgi:hemin uptake protein HemP|uniref:Hemin uptake protein HemP n=1 Tax=Rhodanobacter ginsenosidimutans TaxID=490571 RepID=A0ABW0JV42_9GAMM|nr:MULTISPECIES: hemin uptake protein HemP [unclassified Rhodanobacter]
MSPSSQLLSSPVVSIGESRRRPLSMTTSAVRRVNSLALLDGARELVIQHQGNEYHLRLTRNDKLILTK